MPMISTKGRYALRVMLDLAVQNRDNYTPLDEIANRQGISKKYLETILKTLVKENMLIGLRGKGGGYKLTREASEYKVLEILELTEGTLAPVACLKSGAGQCERMADCYTLPMWKRFDRTVRDFFEQITLEDLLKESDHH